MILQQPFPGYRQSASSFRFGLIAGAVVFLIILFFRPFGLSAVESSFFPLHALLYGVGTFVMVALNSYFAPQIFPSLFAESRWTVGKELLMMLWQIMSISIINMLITHWLYNDSISLITAIYFFAYTAAIGIFPITILILLKYVLLLKKNETAAAKIGEQLSISEDKVSALAPVLQLTGDYQNEMLHVAADAICFISSADNYIKVTYLDGEHLTSTMLRSTLKKAEQSLVNHPQFFRCHRTYIVNLKKVKAVSGNAQGLKLHLDGTEEVIPVSRSLHQQLSHLLQQQKNVVI